MIELHLSWPPSVNHYYGRGRGGRMFIKKRGMDFRAEVSDAAADAKCQSQEGDLAMFVWLYPPDKRKRDCDNVLKALQDALQHAGCYDNDCQIKCLHVEMGEVQKGGKVFVQIVAHRTASQMPLVDYPDNRKDL